MSTLEEFTIKSKPKSSNTSRTTLDDFLIVAWNWNKNLENSTPLEDTQNKIKESKFNEKYNNVLTLLNSNTLLKSYSKVLSWFDFSKLNKKTKTEIMLIFDNIINSNKLNTRLTLIWRLQEITRKYEENKKVANSDSSNETEELNEDIKNAPKIENPMEFIKSLLEANKWYLDLSTKKVSDIMNEATTLSTDEVYKKLAWNPLETTWNIFDVEPEEWGLYFEEHNIPEVKQNQMKKYFSKLMENKDFGNTLTNKFKNDFGTKISDEADRIMSLWDGEKITLKWIPELNPSWEILEFSDKKSALLYLYYNKILLREVATFLEDIIVWWKNIWNWIMWLVEWAYEHFSELIILTIWYMWINTILSIWKKINASIINSHIPIIRHLSIWEYLEESDAFIEWWSDTKEAVQLKKRKEVIKKLKDYYEAKWDNKNLKIVEDAEKYINVLDHKLDIPSEKEWVKFWERFRFSEWIFWRKLAQLNWEGALNKKKWIDILFKPYLLSTRGRVITFVENIDRRDNVLKDWVKNELINESWKNKSFLKQAENFIKKSHEIPNHLENEILEEFNKIVENLKKWNFGEYSDIKNKTEFLKAIKSNILNKLNSKFDWLNLEKLSYTQWNKLDNAKDLFFDWFSDFEPERGTNKMNKWVENLFEWDPITDSQLREIKKFFAEIQRWTNEYNQKTSLDILARIIKKDLSYKAAIDDSFKVKWEHIEKINVDSDLKWSLDNLLTKIDNWNYTLDINNSTKRSDVTKITTTWNSISDDLEEKWSKERNKRAKELKKERQKRDKLNSKKAKEKIKTDLKDLEKLKNIDSTEFKNNKISITFLGFADSTNSKNIIRQVLIINKNTFWEAKSILEEMWEKDKLVLSDKAKWIKSLLELWEVEIKDMKNNLLLNSKEYLSQKYKDTINNIKNFSVKEKFDYLKDKFWWIEKIPKYFSEKYEKVWELINYYKYKKLFINLELQLISKGKFEEADEIYKILYEINQSPKKLKELLEENKDIFNLKEYYSTKYLDWENFKTTKELKILINKFKNINFNTITESDFKTKMTNIFNVEPDFSIKSFDDVKKIFKRIF